VIKFINELENLRNALYDNSKDILELLEKRMQIAKKIGEFKNSEGLKIRNREREIEILKSLSEDRFKEAVLNILFEFSINYEVTHRGAPDSVKCSYFIDGTGYVEFRSERENLIFILSKLLNPGSIISCENEEIREAMSMAGHHVISVVDVPDLIIYLDGRKDQDIIIREDSMLVSEKFLKNKENIYYMDIR
jgi:chorismate mutase